MLALMVILGTIQCQEYWEDIIILSRYRPGGELEYIFIDSYFLSVL